MISRRSIGWALSAPVTLWLLAAFATPFAVVVLLSMHEYADPFGPILRPPSQMQFALVLGDPFYLRILLKTLALASAVTLMSVLLGYPLALWLVAVPKRWRALAFMVVLIPLLTNVVVRSLGLVLLLSPDGLINSITSVIGLPPLRGLLYNHGAVTLALAQVFMPYMVLSLYDSLQSCPPHIHDAAKSLGAPPIIVFWYIRFPMALPGLRAGIILVFLMASTAYVSATLLGGGRVLTTGMLVYREAISNLNYPTASALTLVMTLASLIFATFMLVAFHRIMPWSQTKDVNLAKARTPPAIPASLIRFIEPLARLLSRLLLLIALTLLILPLYLVIVQSVNDVPSGSSARFRSLTWKWYDLVLTNGYYTKAFMNSVLLATVATLIAIALALPAAFVLTRFRFRSLEGLGVFWRLPLSLPGVAMGIGMLQLLSIFVRLPPFLGLLAIHVVIVVPFCISLLVASIIQLDRDQEEAAASLGANLWRRLILVILPGLTPGLMATAILAFLTSFGEVTVTSFLTTARMTTLPVRIYADASFMLEPTVHAVSVLTMLVTFIALAVLNRVLRLDRLYVR
jgi:putative spermidine/putrescine transport system permease protein